MKRNKKTNRSGYRPRQVSELCRGFLPAGFREHRSRIDQYQHFFEGLDSDAVFAMVEVVNVSDNVITLSLPSPALVNYLRLHQEYIASAIQEQFGHRPLLKLIVSPGGKPKIEDGRDRLAKAQPVSARVPAQISAGAELVEDEELRDALRSLAQHLKRDRG